MSEILTVEEKFEKLKEEREKVAHNTKVEVAFCFVYLAYFIAKRWCLKFKKKKKPNAYNCYGFFFIAFLNK